MNNRIAGIGTLDWRALDDDFGLPVEYDDWTQASLMVVLAKPLTTPEDMCDEDSQFFMGGDGWEVERGGGETEGEYDASGSVLPQELLYAFGKLVEQLSGGNGGGCWLRWRFQNQMLIQVAIATGIPLEVRDHVRFVCATAEKLSRWCREYREQNKS